MKFVIGLVIRKLHVGEFLTTFIVFGDNYLESFRQDLKLFIHMLQAVQKL